MASAVYSVQSSSPARWSGESRNQQGAPSEIIRSEEVVAERDASLAAESIPRAFPGMIGASEALKRVLTQVQRVASTDATVLLEGETGTGTVVREGSGRGRAVVSAPGKRVWNLTAVSESWRREQKKPPRHPKKKDLGATTAWQSNCHKKSLAWPRPTNSEKQQKSGKVKEEL